MGERFYIEFHPGYEKDGDGDWTVWPVEGDWPEPLYVGWSRFDCWKWIVSEPPAEPALALAEGHAPRPTERESSRDTSLPLEPNTLREEGAAQSNPCTDAQERSHDEQSFDGKED